jgi:hypothetical protein
VLTHHTRDVPCRRMRCVVCSPSWCGGARACVAVANCAINEELGTLWGAVLERNRTLTSLSLESNTLQTESLEAISKALAATPALRELRLANQHKSFAQARCFAARSSDLWVVPFGGLPDAGWPAAHPEADGSRLASAQASEATLADAMEQNHCIVKVGLRMS